MLSLLLAAALGLSAQPVTLRTPDGWRLSADYRPPRKGGVVAVLVHGAQAGKGEWDAFAAQLRRRGLGTLALDLRGHGASTAGPRGKEGFSSFSAIEWAKMDLDVEAAVSFLNKKGIKDGRIGLMGGSLGANLCAQVGARRSLAWIVLLSPGANYLGVELVAPRGRVLAAASPGDRYAFAAVEGFGPMQAEQLFASTGHGAQMLGLPSFSKPLLDWLSR